VSSDFPQFPFESSPPERIDNSIDFYPREPGPGRREWIISALLFSATFLSTTFAGLFFGIGDIVIIPSLRAFIHRPSLILYGLPFSVSVILILLAHELGHFFACRYYGMKCTPPFFIPLPISIAGTLGAFIRIKSSFRHRRALFDVGVAGPLAGFLFVLPILWMGIRYSTLINKGSLPSGGLSFGEPLIFRFFGMLILGYSPEKQDMIAHPMAMAAWFGLLATSLNLLPIWQLDGGHIAYAIWGQAAQKKISIISVVALILLSFWGWPTPSYLLFGLLLLLVGARLRFYHPPPQHEEPTLGLGRILIALLAWIILVVSFIPVPVKIG
jgi:membrane-associated protease RseP (regulator of RpoE activity)